ncbi:MAG: stage 0 sporulation family protein [Lachnospiraceae bacterium]|nr:stage 0 sporulation family protein [Lachnospiraceae bacterium]MCD7765071.1 stage 0 sporulation family protein [Lachnospiraceae bacterium]
MVKIIGVRFRDAGKVYYFDPKSFEIHAGNHVIVETAQGIEYGTAIGGVREVTDDEIVQPLKEVVRVATADDDARALRCKEKEKEAMVICREKIAKRGLEMKLIDAEYTFDNSKLLFYFTADGRVDFRELVKDLASVFRMRIELRQVGVRDETKLLGGIGICGRVLCCHSYLSDFAPVSIRMAKEQNLSLNPTKISGVCGRLMCCLKNEEETYEYLNSRMPGQGDTVTTADGRQGTVQGLNVLRQRVKVLFEENDEKEIEEFDVADLTFRPRRKKEKPAKNRDKKEKDHDKNADHNESTDKEKREEQGKHEHSTEGRRAHRRPEPQRSAHHPE